MSDHVVKCPAGATIQCVCTLYHCAVVMANPGMMHFTSLVQSTYMSLLFRSASNIHELELFQWEEILSSFWLKDLLVQVLKIPVTNLEHSSLKMNLKVPYIWCCLRPSQCTGICSVFFFCGFFFSAAFSLLGVGRTSIGLVSAACKQLTDYSLHLYTCGV